MPRQALPTTCEKSAELLNEALLEWFSGEAGQRLMGAERALLAQLSKDVFGYYAVQLQDCGHGLEPLHDCPVRNRCLLGEAPAEGLAVRAVSEQLPLLTDAVDLAVLPHTLDFADHPQQVLREVERILIPDGRMIVVGFNPYSMWGLWRLFRLRNGQVPWCGHFVSYQRISDWLGLLGFDVEYVDVCAFAPPTRREPWPWLERLGRKWLPMFAGVYVVRAVKRVSTVRPLRMRWSGLRVSRSRAIEPTTLNGMRSSAGPLKK